jgi:formate dehydrogenase subunit beta
LIPDNADITVALLGEADLDTRCTLHVNTEKGAAFMDGLEGSATSGELESESVQRALGRRESFREELFAGAEVGMQGLIRTFGRCIGCHACKTVCPICYCRLCHFDSRDSERSPEFYDGELERKGGLRVPPDTVFFQLGRMAHMSLSCVGCGMCTDVCPADIPLSTLFSKVGSSAQALFEYQPGRDVTEEIPLRTFEEEELAQVAT